MGKDRTEDLLSPSPRPRRGVGAHAPEQLDGERRTDTPLPAARSRVTVCGESPENEQPGTVDQWLDEVVLTAAEHFGRSPRALAELILYSRRGVRVVVIECNHHQSNFLARQLEETLPVEAISWSLADAAEPPSLPLVGTYFHHAEMRARWPHRVRDMHFVALRTDPALRERVCAAAAARSARKIWLVERDVGTACQLAADVTELLSSEFEVCPVVGDPAALFAALPPDHLLLVSPALWDGLCSRVCTDDRVIDPQARIASEDVKRIWADIRRAFEG
jgi:hypothetical protein